MQKFLTNAQMRASDEYTIKVLGIPSMTLMRRAGGAIAAEVCKIAGEGSSIVVVCGSGNNGGDGYICAQALLKKGYSVSVYDAATSPRSKECQNAASEYKGGYTRDIAGDIIIDCLFGTGLCRKVEGEYAKLIEKINSCGAFVVSADIPSGLNGDNGLVMGVAVRADLTIAIGEYKCGHALGDGKDYCGALKKVDIGIVVNCEDCAVAYEDGDAAEFFPSRKQNSNKGTFGSVCLVSGSQKYPGAAALCLSAALRSGCGYVKIYTSPEVKNTLIANYPQALYIPAADLSCASLVIGPGCGDSLDLFNAVRSALRIYRGNFVIDADGINTLAKNGVSVLKEAKCKIILTPHIIEFSRLTGKSAAAILSDPIGCAKSFAEEYGVTVLLKGASTVITDGKRVVLNLRGNSSLAKAGSGDMLAGFMGGTAARGNDLFSAAVCASYVVGAAAEIASAEKTEYCVVSKDVVEAIPFAIKKILNG